VESSTSMDWRVGGEGELVGELVRDVLSSGFFEHVAGSICLFAAIVSQLRSL
jgi:hypothetical protein